MAEYNFIVKKFSELTADEVFEILRARSKIFVVEQRCIYLDPDDADKIATHIYIPDEDGDIAAYLRVFPKEEGVYKIGKVITVRRGQGYGRPLMEKGIETAVSLGAKKAVINAQTHAIGFYEKFGFKVVSGEYDFDGSMHVDMEREF